MIITNRKLLVLFAGLWGLNLQSAWADQVWKPVLEPPTHQGSYRDPAGNFRFPIPATLSVEYLRQITLELDDVDVTALIRRDGDYAIFTPAQPLSYGTHHMRIVHYASDGNIEELANWEFEVRQSRYYRQSQLEGLANVNLNHLLEQKNLVPKPKQNSADGTAGVSGAVSDKDWQVNGRADFMGNSNYEALNLPRGFDVTNFLFSGQRDNFSANVGHHSIVSNSLVLDTLTNRGMSATLSNTRQTYAGTVFAMRATPVTGFEHGLGVSDADNRIDGAIVSAFPFADHPEQQYLSLVYVKGSSDSGVNGAGVVGDNTMREGNAWELVSESKFKQQQIRLRLEYAKAALSTTDGVTTLSIPELDDNAYAALAEYQPTVTATSSVPTQWKLGLLHQFVGRDFSSIANAALPRDKLLWRLFSEISRGGFFATAGLSTESDNVRDEADMPRIRTNRFDITTQYAPQLEFGTDGQPVYGLLGQQSYLVSLVNGKSKNISTPSASLIPSTDLDTFTVNLTASFTYPSWNWSILQSIGKLHDNENVQPDSETSTTSLSGYWQLGTTFTLTPRWQVDKNKLSDYENKTDLRSLDLAMLFWNGDLSLQFGYTRSSLRSSDGLLDTVSNIYRPAVEWRLLTGARNKPSTSLRLSGVFTGLKDKVTDSNNIDTYQIMLTAIVGAQFGL